MTDLEQRAYLEKHGVEKAIAAAVLEVLRTCPDDPVAEVGKLLLASRRGLKVGFGFSSAEDASTAVKEAVATSGVSAATFGIISCTVDRDVSAVAAAFAAALPGVPLHGTTSCGNILQAASAQPGVACLLFAAPAGAFEVAYAEEAAAAADQLKSKTSTPTAILMTTTPGSEEAGLAAIAAAFPSVPVFGGTAADNELNGSWRVLTADGAKENGFSLVAVGSGIKFSGSMCGPYQPTNKHVTVTKAEGRKVFELDGKPALEWAVEWLGDAVKEQAESGGLVLPATADKPIATKKGDLYVPAHLAALNPADKSVDFFAPMATGDELVVMSAADGPATGYAACLSDAYDQAAAKLGAPKAGILLYCGGMSIAVGDSLKAGLSDETFVGKVKGLPMLGMTVFGEQACMAGLGNVQRNLSMGFLLFE